MDYGGYLWPQKKRYFVRITIKSYIVLINENLTNKLNSVEAKLDKLMEAPTQVFIEINTKLDAITQNLPPKTYSDATAANIVPQLATIVQQVEVELPVGWVCLPPGESGRAELGWEETRKWSLA